MSDIHYSIRPEQANDAPHIDLLTRRVFGPGMKARAAYVLREGVGHEEWASFVAELDGNVVGSVRLTWIKVGDEKVLLLGPLGVLPEFKDKGIGRALMHKAVENAKAVAADKGNRAILLVGDLAYYQAFGFEQVKPGSIRMPRPVDPNRVLLCFLDDDNRQPLSGIARSIVA